MSIAFELLLERIASKLLRPILRNHRHSRHLSPSFFRLMVEKINKHTDGRAVFVQTHNLNQLLYSDDYQTLPKLVIAGDSDYEISKSEYLRMREINSRMFFVQNLSFPETTNVKLLPIGIEDLRWAKNGFPIYLRPLPSSLKLKKILVGPFRPTHLSRNELLQIKKVPSLEIVASAIPAWRYASISRKYAYIACPRGNGLDTHRFWETLYRGGIPVVLSSEWTKTLRGYGIGMIEIEDWSMLQELANPANSSNLYSPSIYLSTDWWETRLFKAATADSSR
jgi:hypothetical protein